MTEIFKGRLAILGLGYIGLPTAVAIATRGIDVTGVDINPAIVAAICRGEVPFVEPDLAVGVSGAVAMGRLVATSEVPEADAFIIAVPTPFNEDRTADLSYVRAAAEQIATRLRPGNIVVLESTSPPGTTEMVSSWISAVRPDLRMPRDGQNGADIYVAHCPERVLPGRIMIEIITNDRVVGGLTPACAQKAASIYRLFAQGEILLTDAASAELAKLVENAYRDVNIAFANELSLISEALHIDVWEVIRLANRHPRVKILSPGPGVGGHCIPVDPWFIVSAAPGLAGVQQIDGLQDGGLGGGIDGAGGDGITALEGRFDGLLQLGHDRFPLKNSVCCITLFQSFLRALADFFKRKEIYCT